MTCIIMCNKGNIRFRHLPDMMVIRNVYTIVLAQSHDQSKESKSMYLIEPRTSQILLEINLSMSIYFPFMMYHINCAIFKVAKGGVDNLSNIVKKGGHLNLSLDGQARSLEMDGKSISS